MAVTNIPNVQNWTVTPQNGQVGYFTAMNTWLGQSTLVIASLQSAITAQNAANSEINALASQTENNAIIATGLANYQGEHNTLTTYSKGQSTSVAGLYYTSKVDGNLDHAVTDTNYWLPNPINDKASTTYVNSIIKKRKNYLTNGNFQFWDYATSQTTNGYGSDNRFDNKHVGSTKLHTRQTSTDTERALFESPYYSRTVVSSVAGAGNGTFKIQRIEDVTKLAGKTITFSVFGRADTNRNIAVYVNQNFGTGGSPSSTVMGITPNTLSLSTNIAKKTFTVTLPSLIGKTLGTDGAHTSFTELVICFEAGSNFNSYTNSLGQQSGTFDIAELKLEDGSMVTDGWAPYDGEWGSEPIARMRYLQYVDEIFQGIAIASTERIQRTINFPVQMRVVPSATSNDFGQTRTNLTNPSFELQSTSLGSIYVETVATGWYSSLTNKFILSAELG